VSAAATTAATTATAVPPFRRDRLVQGWAATAALSRLGDAAWLVGLAWTATRVAGPAEAGLVLGAGTLPRAVVTVYGGALADRTDPRRVMVLANLGRVLVLLAGLVAVTYAGPVTALLLGVAVTFGVLDAFYLPAGGTLPRQMVRPDDLPACAALFQIGNRVGTFAGAALGGVLVAAGGLRTVMVADAVSFVAISLYLHLALRPRFPRPATATGVPVRTQLLHGLRYVRESPRVRTLVVSLSGLNLFVGPALAVGVALHVHASGWGATTLGLSDAAVGVGAGLGAAATLRLRADNPARAGLLVLVLQAAGIGVLGLTDRTGLLLTAGVIGVTAGVASAQLSGAFQMIVDPAFLGRMSALTSLGDDVLMPVAMAGFGALAGGAGLPLTCAVTGALFAALVLWGAAGLGSGAEEGE
jgi:MFS family permease